MNFPATLKNKVLLVIASKLKLAKFLLKAPKNSEFFISDKSLMKFF